MSGAPGFPPELLDRDLVERFAYFECYMAAHRLQQETDAALVRALTYARMVRTARPDEPTGAVILVFGPTGVGKTRVRLTVQRRLIAAALPLLGQDPGYIPVCSLDIKGPDADRFSWPDFYERALQALEEPLIAYKLDPHARDPRRGPTPARRPGPANARALRLALEQAVRHRRPDAIFLDEAHHLGKVASGSSFKNQLESIKSLADMTNTAYVLLGTYDLLQFRLLNGQLGRRCMQIHFPRYRSDRAEDVREFTKVLRTFQKHLPLAEEPDLAGAWAYYYERSVGCIGVLKEWLSRALGLALGEGAPTLTREMIERALLPADEVAVMARDIIAGEEALLVEPESYAEVGRILRQSGHALPQHHADAGEGQHALRTAPGRRRRPGDRRPIRDPGEGVQHAG